MTGNLPALRRWGALLLALLLFGGCAGLPPTTSISLSEQDNARLLLQEALAAQEQCNCCLDVQVQARITSTFQSGTISGFLQAMRPSYLKFVGLNPLGQPLMILSSDGVNFRYVAVPEARSYEGLVTAEKFKKYAPQGFSPASAFAWLTGRLPGAGLQILSVARAAEGQGLWYEVAYPGEEIRRHILFSPEERTVLRHILVDRSGDILLDVLYEKYRDFATGAQAGCPLPGFISVHANSHNGVHMEFGFSDWLPDARFTEDDFVVRLPSGFAREVVQ